MAKFHNLGFVGVPKADAKKRYAKINKGYTVVVKTPSGAEITLPEGSFINMFEPRKSEKQTDEQFEALKAWKRFDLVVITDD